MPLMHSTRGGKPPGDRRQEVYLQLCRPRSVFLCAAHRFRWEVAASFVGDDRDNGVTTDVWRGYESRKEVMGRS